MTNRSRIDAPAPPPFTADHPSVVPPLRSTTPPSLLIPTGVSVVDPDQGPTTTGTETQYKCVGPQRKGPRHTLAASRAVP